MQFEWTVFFGDAADAEARVYVLATPIGDAADAASLEGLKITGRVEGPKCRYSHTLPARIPVRHRGVRKSDSGVELVRLELVGEAIVPDPNFWTPDLPFLYQATVEVRRGDEVVASYEQDFGIRPLGVRGKRLVFDGKTWVPRAVRREIVVGEAPLELWRETATVMVVDDPSDALCREASEIGVILFAKLSKTNTFEQRLSSLGRFASVALVISAGETLADVEHRKVDVRALAKNALLADAVSLEPGMYSIPKSRHLSVVFVPPKADEYELIGELKVNDRPCLVQRSTGKRSLVEAREACDALQADLAGKCDPAGYIV